MTLLLAERSFAYAGRTVHAGESFEPKSANDALVLKVGGFAVDSTMLVIESEHQSPAVDKPKRIYRRRAVEARDAD